MMRVDEDDDKDDEDDDEDAALTAVSLPIAV